MVRSNRRRQDSDYDGAWKEALHQYFREILKSTESITSGERIILRLPCRSRERRLPPSVRRETRGDDTLPSGK